MKVDKSWTEEDFVNFLNENWKVSCSYGDDEDWIHDLINSNFKKEWQVHELKAAVKEDLETMTLNQIFVKYTDNTNPYVEDVE